MSASLLTPDPDHVDRTRCADLGDQGLPGYGVGVVITRRARSGSWC